VKIHQADSPEQSEKHNTFVAVKNVTTGSKLRYWIPRLSLAALILSCVTTCIVFKQNLMSVIQDFIVWSRAHSVAGPFLVALIISLVVIALLPYSIVAAAAGWAFNQTFKKKVVAIVVGSTAVFVGAWFGALISFLLGRYLVRDQVQSLSQKFKIIRSLDKTFET